MSKHSTLFSRRMYLPFLFCIFIANAFGQVNETAMTVELSKLPLVSVNVQTARGRSLSFARSVAGIDNLADRVSNVRARRGTETIPLKSLGSGEYVAESDFDAVSYDLDLTPPKRRSAAAHVSWFGDKVGILMGADIFPRVRKGPVSIDFVHLPAGFEIFSYESGGGSYNFRTDDLENAVFFVGSAWRNQAVFRQKDSAQWILSGEWQFTDLDVTSTVADILVEYQKIFHDREPLPRVTIGIVKFPMATPPGEWEAETRGHTVTIVSSDTPFKAQSRQRLHEQLRHEIFHLWIPNGVNLTGNYDWFYEGFAMYESLKLAVDMNRIRFEDFLDTLSRAHTIDSAIPRKISLVEASKNRFSGSNTQVYARGMLVAFLCDVTLLQKSKGKLDVEDILVELMRKYRKPQQPSVDSNAAVIKILRDQAGAGQIVDKYIEGTDVIDLSIELKDVGIEDADPGSITTLRVKEKLSGRQKALLDKLGYNSWRKLTVPSK